MKSGILIWTTKRRWRGSVAHIRRGERSEYRGRARHSAASTYRHGKNPKCRLASPALVRLLLEGLALDRLCVAVNGSRCFQHLFDLLTSHNPHPWEKVKCLTLDISMLESDVSTPLKPVHGVPSCITGLNLRFPRFANYDQASPIEPSVFEHLISLSLNGPWRGRNGGVGLAALAHCINLEVLTLDLSDQQWIGFEGSKAVELPKLDTSPV